jgi:hypothetical protein
MHAVVTVTRAPAWLNETSAYVAWIPCFNPGGLYVQYGR